MPRKRTGTIVEQLGRDGVARHSLRVTSGGRRHFVSLGDVSHGEAQEQLDQALREIAAGVWESPRNARRFAEHPERFFERRGPDDCWLWTGQRNPQGYGKLGQTWAHRAVYSLLVGPVPDGLVLHHVCEVKLCVNPAHRPLTQAEHLRLHARISADSGIPVPEAMEAGLEREAA